MGIMWIVVHSSPLTIGDKYPVCGLVGRLVGIAQFEEHLFADVDFG